MDWLINWRRRATWVDYFLLALRLGVLLIVGFGVTNGLISQKYSSSDWALFLTFGLTMGGMYSLVALGYTMVFGILRMINMAHGDVMMLGAYAGMIAATAFAQSGFLAEMPFVAIPLVFISSVAVSIAASLFVERVASRPFLHVRSLASFICTLGLSITIEYSVRGLFGTRNRAYPDIAWFDERVTLLGVTIPVAQVVAMLTALAMMLILWSVVRYSSLGRAMRAVSEDRDAAALVGIDVGRVILLTFAIGGAMAGVAGVLYGIVFKQIQVFLGFPMGIKAFGAAILGGIGNIPGAMCGGLLLGVAEAVGPALLLDGLHVPAPNQLRDIISYGMLVLVLIFRPQGIFGERVAGRRA
jgi:branched-chain amino acid transport system permease protein